MKAGLMLKIHLNFTGHKSSIPLFRDHSTGSHKKASLNLSIPTHNPTMCEEYYSKKIYVCGDTIEDVVNFNRCENPSREGHEVKRCELGSSRQAGKCGRVDCRNP
ncbi:hypothetical protein F5Y02DRAFT_389794 [Annulohypoxylon stygium]|nr:hypothetical protein F5Y02DRAFT_389794 [Annulohypoxylon stygium]